MDLTEYKALIANPKRKRKYRNKPVTLVNGLRFDSEKEAKHWGLLNILLTKGEISDLRRQVRFVLCEKPRKSYVADFVYIKDGKQVVEDVKGFITANYMTKKAWMIDKFGITIKEI